MDSESAVKVLTSDSDVSRSPYCSAILRTRELLLRHKIELIWIPAHSTEKKLNENKTHRLKYINDRFPDDFEWIVSLNTEADTAANKGRMKSGSGQEFWEPGYVISENSKIVEGSLAKILKQKNKSDRVRLTSEHLRTSTNGDIIDMDISNHIYKIKEFDRELDSVKMFILRLRHGGLYSLDNGFSLKPKEAFNSERHNLLYYTRRCETHNCINTTQHMLFECKTIPNDIIQTGGHSEENEPQWWDGENVDQEIDDDLIEFEPAPKRRRTISDYFRKGEIEDPDEMEVREIRALRERDERIANIRRLGGSRKRINPARKGYVTSEHTVKNNGKKKKEKKKRADPKEETYYQFINFMKYLQSVYVTFWKEHTERMRRLGSKNSKILNRYFHKTSIT